MEVSFAGLGARARADVWRAGHYVGWHRVDRTTTVGEIDDPDKAEWYRFDDDKVSTVSREKITSLDGGGALAPAALVPKLHLTRVCIYQARTTRRTSSCTRRRSSSRTPTEIHCFPTHVALRRTRPARGTATGGAILQPRASPVYPRHAHKAQPAPAHTPARP